MRSVLPWQSKVSHFDSAIAVYQTVPGSLEMENKRHSWFRCNDSTFSPLLKHALPVYLHTAWCSAAGTSCTVYLCVSPGLCGCTALTQDRPCPQRRLYTSLGAGRLSGAASGPPWGNSAGSHSKGTRSLCKWVSVWCRRHTAGPGSHGEASWFENKRRRKLSTMSRFSSQKSQNLHFPAWLIRFLSHRPQINRLAELSDQCELSELSPN